MNEEETYMRMLFQVAWEDDSVRWRTRADGWGRNSGFGITPDLDFSTNSWMKSLLLWWYISVVGSGCVFLGRNFWLAGVFCLRVLLLLLLLLLWLWFLFLLCSCCSFATVVVVVFVVGFLGFPFQALLLVLVVLFSGLCRRGRRWRLYAF